MHNTKTIAERQSMSACLYLVASDCKGRQHDEKDQSKNQVQCQQHGYTSMVLIGVFPITPVLKGSVK
jgi:hypothetical protein